MGCGASCIAPCSSGMSLSLGSGRWSQPHHTQVRASVHSIECRVYMTCAVGVELVLEHHAPQAPTCQIQIRDMAFWHAIMPLAVFSPTCQTLLIIQTSPAPPT